MASSPTQRSLDRLRAIGYVAGVCEKWLPRIKKRKDLFGFADVAAVRPDKPGTLYIQATTRGHISHRLAKMVSIPALRIVLEAGNRVEIWGWRKRNERWDVLRRNVTLEDLET